MTDRSVGMSVLIEVVIFADKEIPCKFLKGKILAEVVVEISDDTQHRIGFGRNGFQGGILRQEKQDLGKGCVQKRFCFVAFRKFAARQGDDRVEQFDCRLHGIGDAFEREIVSVSLAEHLMLLEKCRKNVCVKVNDDALVELLGLWANVVVFVWPHQEQSVRVQGVFHALHHKRSVALKDIDQFKVTVAVKLKVFLLCALDTVAGHAKLRILLCK